MFAPSLTRVAQGRAEGRGGAGGAGGGASAARWASSVATIPSARARSMSTYSIISGAVGTDETRPVCATAFRLSISVFSEVSIAVADHVVGYAQRADASCQNLSLLRPRPPAIFLTTLGPGFASVSQTPPKRDRTRLLTTPSGVARLHLLAARCR